MTRADRPALVEPNDPRLDPLERRYRALPTEVQVGIARAARVELGMPRLRSGEATECDVAVVAGMIAHAEARGGRL